MKNITVLIPCYNEQEGIRQVVRAFPRELLLAHGYELEILVIDNNSSDNTARVARRAGARVVFEAKKGKGNAIRTGMASLSSQTDYVVMLDGDDTYSPSEIIRLVEPLSSLFCNVVIGSRLGGRISDGSMKTFNLMGNWIYSHLVRYFYHVNVTDVLTGYFAWTKEVVEELRPHLTSDGFAIEMEMITKMARLGHEIYSVPISYHARAGESNLRPIYDGARILKMFIANLSWTPEPGLSPTPATILKTTAAPTRRRTVAPKAKATDRNLAPAFGERIKPEGE
jgi:glycosyltransferase involved in cell wall biosynthesis